MNWSTNGQTPEFLAATRMVSLNDDVIAAILLASPLDPGARVLDVGCGSGEYAFRLGAHTRGVDYCGLDFDDAFIEFANRRTRGLVPYPYEQPNPANNYRFVQGDGTSLPFDEGSFDAVISHTYLTALPQWEQALAEMIRVCKPGGVVSSITNMTDNFYGAGSVSLFASPLPGEDAQLVGCARSAAEKAAPSMDITAGITPYEAPRAFARSGLEGVFCIPLGHYLSLSDARMDAAEARRYIDLLELVELRQLDMIAGDAGACTLLPEADQNRYRSLIDRRHAELIDSIDANDEWEWFGNTSLFVCGTKP